MGVSLIQNLIRQYDDFEIAIPHWELADTGVTALMGPSGSGKSSIIRLLLGLDDCPSLAWTFQGQDLAQLPVGERRLSVVFQNYELFGHLTARENIEFALRARGQDVREQSQAVSELISKLQLQKCADRKARVLSGGEKQRVALARALIAKPRFLFLDEPFAALDTNHRAEARALVKKVIADAKIPTLLVSHDADDIRDLAQQVVRLENGRLIDSKTSKPF